MTPFGKTLRRLRRRAGLGLRTFADLIGERASTVSAMEQGHRSPWHREDRLTRVADVLGLAGSSAICQEFREADDDAFPSPDAEPPASRGEILWWWSTDHAPPCEEAMLAELADFLRAEIPAISAEQEARACPAYSPLTELAVEWRVRRLLGRRDTQVSAAPVDVEAVLENQAGVQLEILPGLIPRFSILGCAVRHNGQLTLLVDRIVADSRPLAAYRELLARLFAPAALWQDTAVLGCHRFLGLQHDADWPLRLRDCERFALSLLLPAGPVLSAAQAAYREVVEQQSWVETETATCAVRNRLAEQFAVPPLLVHTRLIRWPCHVYGRIAQALAAQEIELPPVDWFIEHQTPHQRELFAKR
jgi:transcriptional regulator with XRE-family HTH domain